MVHQNWHLLVIYGFSESDWASSADDRRSTMDYVFSSGFRAVSWSSKKQPSIIPSSLAAEHGCYRSGLSNNMIEKNFGRYEASSNGGNNNLLRWPVYNSNDQESSVSQMYKACWGLGIILLESWWQREASRWHIAAQMGKLLIYSQNHFYLRSLCTRELRDVRSCTFLH